MSVKTKLQSLLGYANETTGESDTNLTDAVSNLIDGYGGITPSGSISITSNGTYDVTEKETAEVNVPNPSTGTLSITSNGTYDVTDKASAEVNVPSQTPVITPLSITANGTYTPPTGTDGYAPVTVNVSGGVTPAKGFVPTAWDADGWITEGTVYGMVDVPNNFLYGYNTSALGAPHGPAEMLEKITFPSPVLVKTIGNYAFDHGFKLSDINIFDSPVLETIGKYAFNFCRAFTSLNLPASLKTIDNRGFLNCNAVTDITFNGTPQSIDSTAFMNCTAVTDIYVPWADGTVANAPWGATNATIHFSWTPTV